MNAAKQHLEYIREYQKIVDRTDNPHIRNDYTKAIKRLEKELKTYCMLRGFDYKEVLKKFGGGFNGKT